MIYFLKRILGLTTQYIDVPPVNRTLFQLSDNATVEEIESVVEIRKLLAGKPLKNEC